MRFPVEHQRFCVKPLNRGIGVTGLLILSTGCTQLPRSAPPPVPAPVVVEAPVVCDSDWMARQQRLVRDLTAPYGTRRYIRSDGSVCEPPTVAEALAIQRNKPITPAATRPPMAETATIRPGPAAVETVMVVETVHADDPASKVVMEDGADGAVGDQVETAWYEVFTPTPPTADDAQIPSVWNPGVMDL